MTCIPIDKLNILCRICNICNTFDPCIGTGNVKLKLAAFIKMSAVYQAQSVSTLSHYMTASQSCRGVCCKIRSEETYLHIRILSSAGRWPHLPIHILKHFNILFSLWSLGLLHYHFEGCHHCGGISSFPSYTLKLQAAPSVEAFITLVKCTVVKLCTKTTV